MSKQKKVLIVEDDVFWTEKWRKGLNNNKVSIEVADSIEKAESLLKKYRFDAIIMDCSLKNDKEIMTFSLLNKVRSVINYRGPIIASSSSSTYRKEMMKRGCSHETSKSGVILKLAEVLYF
ncbi:MAG: response regulator [Patescibacteria group bacterium]|nr:response regulator [Patescibacteria group bacterium]MDE1988337.1 response regulator [Patescibacteria group bacterium]MDE2218644.1 response regulator [Patescibacteria group bacterium]